MGEPLEPEVDFTKLPIDERCQHKNWKARVSGYESLAQLFSLQDDEKSVEFNKYVSILRKFPVDSNAAAQEKGLAAVAVFVENASPSISSRIASEVISGIITKCLISPKVKTKELACDIVLMYIEVEKQEVVIEELLKGTENKSPKIVCGCICLLKESLRLFGPRIIKPTPLIKMITKGLEDRDKNVREESKQLTVEIYRWMKDAFKPQLAGLKPVQLSELEIEFEKIKSDKAQPVRYIRSEQERGDRETVVVAGDSCDGQCVSEVNEDIDPYELLEPVEILNKLPSDFYTNCESKKWAERKAALDSLEELLTPNPKLASGDYGDLVRLLKNLIKKDSNINVVATAAKCMGDLASRLRKSFQPYAHSTIAVIIEKLKEKKQNVVSALREAMDACMLSISLETILEDITSALQNKNPQIKAESASFLTRQFSITSYTVLGEKKLLKTLVSSLIVTLNDMDASVRDAAAEAIGTVQKVVGEKAMTPLLTDVDAIKLAKIKEFHDKATVKFVAPAGGFKGSVVRPETAAPGKSTIVSKPSSRSASVGELPILASRKKVSPLKPIKRPVIPAKPRTDTGLKRNNITTSAPSLPLPTVAPSNRRTSGQGFTAQGTAGNRKDPDLDEEVKCEVSAKTVSSKVPAPGSRKPLPKFVPKGKKSEEQQQQQLHTSPSKQRAIEPMKSPSQNHDDRHEDGSDEETSESSSEGGGKTYNLGNGGRSVKGKEMKKNVTRMIPLSPGKEDVALSLTMNQLTAQDPDDAIEGFNQLKQILNKPDRAESLLGSKVDQIIYMCNLQYRLCTNKLADESSSSLSQVINVLKAVTSVLDSLFKHPTLKKIPSREVLRELMPQIISIILDPKLNEDEEGKTVSRSVNVLATCIIVSADATNMMRALIKLLHDCVGGGNSHSNQRTIEMIMKCIWKMLRFVPQFIDHFNIDRILLDIHIFMKEYPSDFWKKDASRSDTPLRTVKTIVYFLVEAKLEEIMNHLTLIPDPSSSELVGYIGRAMKQVKKKNESIRPLATQGQYKLNDRDAQQLSDIFAKLGSLNPTEGFQELNHFLQTRPEFDIEKHLESSTSEFFIKFVMEGLGKINSNQVRSPLKEDNLRVTTNGSPALSSLNGKSPLTNGNGSNGSTGSGNLNGSNVIESNVVGSNVVGSNVVGSNVVGSGNGSFQVGNNSISSLKSPEVGPKPNRPKLGRLSGNVSGIPGPSAIPVAGFRFARLPPPDQMSPGDVFDFIKNSHQTLGFDPAKVHVTNLQRTASEIGKELTATPGTRLKQVESMAEETRLRMINFKQKYNSEQS